MLVGWRLPQAADHGANHHKDQQNRKHGFTLSKSGTGEQWRPSHPGKFRDWRSRAPARLMYFNTLGDRQSDTLSAKGTR
jgi:hypothetical protein